MSIEHGSYCYRFADAEHAAAMLDALGDSSGITAVPWGPLMEPDGVDEEGNPKFVTKRGFLVFAFQDNDPLPIEAWEPWLYKPPFWPHSFAGRETEQLVGEELVDPIDERLAIPKETPPPLTREERLAARQARLAAVSRILDLREKAEKLRADLARENTEIGLAVDARDDVAERIKTLQETRDRLSQVIIDKAAELATAQQARTGALATLGTNSATPEEKESARQARDAAITAIDVARTARDDAVAERALVLEQLQRIGEEIDKARAEVTREQSERNAVRDELDATIAELQAERAARDAAKQALSGG